MKRAIPLLLLLPLFLEAADLKISFICKLGKVRVRSKKRVTIEATNTGENTTKISKVKASCGCTAVDYPKSPIPPGETVKLFVDYRAGESAGAFRKTVRTWCEGEKEPYVVALTGEVIYRPGQPGRKKRKTPVATPKKTPQKDIKITATEAEGIILLSWTPAGTTSVKIDCTENLSDVVKFPVHTWAESITIPVREGYQGIPRFAVTVGSGPQAKTQTTSIAIDHGQPESSLLLISALIFLPNVILAGVLVRRRLSS